MFRKLFGSDVTQGSTPVPKEGDLFKVIKSHGKIFEIRYGFYEELDRHNRYAEPTEIYPNFIDEPQYTDDGVPFVTAMQTPCEKFNGQRDENSSCEDCAFYTHCEELIGICTCPKNKKQLGDLSESEVR